MTKRFCPKCGATISKGVFCSDCIVKELKYKTPLVQVSEFNRTFHQGRWTSFEDLEGLIIRRVREGLGFKDKQLPITLEPFSFEPKPKQKITLKAHVQIDGQEVILPVKLSYMQCDFGQKEKTQYYEGIIQLRDGSDAVFSFIEKELKKVVNKGIFVTKTVETKKGVDLYLTNKSYVRLLAQKIHAKFGGHMKINPQLFSHNHQTSKNIYRLNVLIELPPFQSGDVVFFIPVGARRKEKEKRIVLVRNRGKITQGLDLLTGKSIAFEYKFAKNLEVGKLEKVQVVSTNPDFLVLDPETFQGVPVLNEELLKNNIKPDEKVVVVRSKHGLVLVKKAKKTSSIRKV